MFFIHTNLGVMDSEKNLVLKYCGCLYRYIQDEMDLLDIPSLGITYHYVIKIEQKFKQKKRVFVFVHPKQGER